VKDAELFAAVLAFLALTCSIACLLALVLIGVLMKVVGAVTESLQTSHRVRLARRLRVRRRSSGHSVHRCQSHSQSKHPSRRGVRRRRSVAHCRLSNRQVVLSGRTGSRVRPLCDERIAAVARIFGNRCRLVAR